MSGFMRSLSLSVHRKGSRAESPSSASPSRTGTGSTTGSGPRQSMSDAVNGHRDSTGHRHSINFKAAGLELVNKLHLDHDSNKELPLDQHQSELSKAQQKKYDKRASQEARRERNERASIDLRKQRQEAMEAAINEDPPEVRARYGTVPVNNYAGNYKANQYAGDLSVKPSDYELILDGKHSGHSKLLELTEESIGKVFTFRVRIHNMRKMSSKLVFFVLRQQTATIQGVLQESPEISKNMVMWGEHLPVETVVDVKGSVEKPKAKEGEVIGATIHDKELHIHELHVVSKLTEHLPFTVNEAETSEMEATAEGSTRHHIGDRARLASRVLDLRTTASQAIFRVQAGVCRLFRNYLDSQGFMEIHSPKLQGGATESGASVFKVDYFGRTAFLAQSPQLAKQMSIAADFGKVFEIGAVFRAENSNTHRHLTEYTGLDIEMALDEHYHEARNLIDRTIKNIFKGVYEQFRPEVEIIKKQFPHEDLVWLDQTPIFKFKDAITMLNETGWLGEDGKPLPLDEDLGTRDEIQLGRVIKEKFHTDYYIIDKFPASARPFYTMPDPEDPTYTNSFDIFVRGQEITTGGERIHDAEMLIASMEKAKVDPKSMEEYMQGFEWGAPPHAGAGIGLERIMMLLLQLGDIRHSSMYPRDPRSLPAKKPVTQLRHPEASTLHPPWEGRLRGHDQQMDELPPIEKLIANYGDASNTSWLEPRTQIWRDTPTGAAVGYVPHNGFAITVGDPLCHSSQYVKIIATYLEYIKKQTDLKPLWLLVGSEVEDVLANKFDWRTFSCAAEQRLSLTVPLRAASDPDVQRKIRHADKEGLKIHDIDIGTPVPKEIVDKCDARIKDWLGNRKSHQHVHLTDVHPWQDMEHRAYYYGVGKDGVISGLVVMAVLSPEHGWQVKYALDFPNSISGSIEALVLHALKAVQQKGAPSVTFGGGATADFKPGQNLKGAKVKMLSRAYHTIANELKLTQKSEFREKLGAEEDPIFVCYPPRGLGPKGVHAILSFFED